MAVADAERRRRDAHRTGDLQAALDAGALACVAGIPMYSTSVELAYDDGATLAGEITSCFASLCLSERDGLSRPGCGGDKLKCLSQVLCSLVGGILTCVSGDAEMEILAAMLSAQFGAAQVDAEQGAVLLEVRPRPLPHSARS